MIAGHWVLGSGLWGLGAGDILIHVCIAACQAKGMVPTMILPIRIPGLLSGIDRNVNRS